MRAGAPLPRTRLVRQFDTHRLIPSKYIPEGDSVLTRVAADADLAAVFDLDAASNDRALAEADRLAGIGPHELIYGVPYAQVVNAAFTHAHPLGSRFNGPDRGAWYAGFELETAKIEVAFHKTIEYAEIGRFDDSVTYDDFLADLSAEFHDLRGDERNDRCLDPQSYVRSQALAERLLEAGSLGVVYSSVRRPRGTCLACFRPTVIGNVRRDATWRFTWRGGPQPGIEREKASNRRR